MKPLGVESSFNLCLTFKFAQLKRSWRGVRSTHLQHKRRKMFRIGPFLLGVICIANWVLDAHGLAVPKIGYQHNVSLCYFIVNVKVFNTLYLYYGFKIYLDKVTIQQLQLTFNG